MKGWYIGLKGWYRAERIVQGCRDVTGLIGDTGLKGSYRADWRIQSRKVESQPKGGYKAERRTKT
jgi:hypothetical protein